MKWESNNMGSIQNEFREKFKKSDALKSLKEISQRMTKDEFLEFSNVAMKSAYDRNKVKAVEYMLSFYEKDKPSLLLRIHLQRMLHDDKDLKSGERMLRVLTKNFSHEFCCEIIHQFIESCGGKTREDCERREKEVSKILLEEYLPINNTTTIKFKI